MGKKLLEKIEHKRLGIALLASVMVHVLLAWMITLKHHDKPLAKKKTPQFMDVVLLKPNEMALKQKPKDAKTISNQNAQGSSVHAKDKMTRRAKAPVVGQQHQKPKPVRPSMPKTSVAPPQSSKKRPEIMTKNSLNHSDGQRSPEAAKKIEKKVVKTKPLPRHPVSLSNLLPSSMALSELSRDFERERRLKQMLSKEADIPINTREAKYAPYAQGLVRSLEEQWRPSDADYRQFSDHARQVLMRVTIELNGEMSNLEILRPSPIQGLNESAYKALHAAAPFKPLPSSWGLDRASFYLTFEVIEDQAVFRAM
ncbi:MAG: TonB C-terminal domain-containing protein [Zetaproteobacteria bacterium]|nr:TonB C-terminal domain-containing protein [Zetaproteobacteria bacterium]